MLKADKICITNFAIHKNKKVNHKSPDHDFTHIWSYKEIKEFLTLLAMIHCSSDSHDYKTFIESHSQENPRVIKGVSGKFGHKFSVSVYGTITQLTTELAGGKRFQFLLDDNFSYLSNTSQLTVAWYCVTSQSSVSL